MSSWHPDGRPQPSPVSGADSPLGRRRFLVTLGLLAGATAAIPVASRLRSRGPHRVESSRAALGTWVRVVVRHPDRATAERALHRAFEAVDQVDAQMSIHRPDSELARVNAAAGERAVPVSAALLEVVERACAASRRSGGIYDPTVLPLMRLWGFYGADRSRWPSDREIGSALARTGCALVIADRATGTLGLTRAGAALDLGSIGKGWAVDRAIAALRAEGVTSGLVDVGRNIYGLGVPEEGSSGWSVGVFHPVTARVDKVFTLRDAAVATSGNYQQWHDIQGRRVGHLLDARAGRPSDEHVSATVQAADGTDADAGSTMAFLLGPTRVQALPAIESAHFIG